MRYLFTTLFSILFFLAVAQDTPPGLLLKAGTTYRALDDLNTPLTFGIGVEAAVNRRFVIAGDVGFASTNDVSYTFVDALLKFYPFQRTKAFHLYTGPGFFSARADDFLPSPFDTDRGNAVGVFKYSVGLGASIFTKDHFYLGFHLGIGAVGDIDLDSDYAESGLYVGYGF